jgi:hypothetical protein
MDISRGIEKERVRNQQSSPVNLFHERDRTSRAAPFSTRLVWTKKHSLSGPPHTSSEASSSPSTGAHSCSNCDSVNSRWLPMACFQMAPRIEGGMPGVAGVNRSLDCGGCCLCTAPCVLRTVLCYYVLCAVCCVLYCVLTVYWLPRACTARGGMLRTVGTSQADQQQKYTVRRTVRVMRNAVVLLLVCQGLHCVLCTSRTGALYRQAVCCVRPQSCRVRPCTVYKHAACCVQPCTAQT